MLKHRIISFFIVCLLLGFLPISIIGEEVSNSRIELEEIFNQVEIHNITIDEEPRKVEIRSVRENEFDDIFFEFEFKADYRLSVELKSGKSNGNDSRSSTLDLDFIGMIEYHDSNSNDRFDSSTDIVASIYPLSNSIYLKKIIQNVRTYNDDHILNITKEQFEEKLLKNFYAGYNFGFDNGLEMGIEEGTFDRINNLTFTGQNYFYHITNKELRLLLNTVEENMETEFEEIDPTPEFSFKEYQNLFENGFYSGFSNGFTDGYKTGFNDEDEDNQSSSSTRSYWSYWSDYDINIFERPEFWLPRYKPIMVEEIEKDNEISDFLVHIDDLRGNFNINCIISNHFSEVENGYLAPSSLKFNLNINNYPYENPDTKLALLTELEIKTSSTSDITVSKVSKSIDESIGFSQDEEELRINGENFTGYFSWVQYAYCDGVKQNIKLNEFPYYSTTWDYSNGNSSHSYKSTHFHLLVSYPRCKNIFHDPKLGITRINDIDLYGIDASSDIVRSTINLDNITFILTTISVVSFVILSHSIKKKFY